MAVLRVGIAGLGEASQLVLPYLDKVEGVRLAAAADVRESARAAFAANYALPVFASVEQLCESREVDAVWIETPNHLHCEHALSAAAHNKHVIVAKPMAASVDECDRMIEGARRAGVRLLLGHSKIFDSPVRAMADIARSGRLGRVIHIDSWWYNDWLRRPRLTSDLDESLGAGFILRQAPHLADIVAYIVGARAVSLRAVTGRWDEIVPTHGNCASLIQFEGGALANISLNGYGYFETSLLTWDIGLFGSKRAFAEPQPRRPPSSADEKYSLTRDRTAGKFMPFVGLTLVSCERGLIRQSPGGLYLYTDDGSEEIAVSPYLGRAAELIELRDALAEDRDVFPNGEWGNANLEICLAILQSARERRDIALSHQASPVSRQ